MTNNHVDNPFKSPLTLSFCSGILGLERGLERAIGKLRVAAYVEIETFNNWNLIALMEAGLLDASPVWTDVKTFPGKDFHRKIHGITGGYPCQPFSLSGHRKGTSDPRHLWPFIAKQIGAIRPVWCFFENVDDHLTLGFDEVQKDLWRLGYAVEAGVYSAQEAGAPHERQRLFILAIEVGYANSHAAKGQLGSILSSCGTNEVKAHQWKRNRDAVSGTDTEVGDTNAGRFEKFGEQLTDAPEHTTTFDNGSQLANTGSSNEQHVCGEYGKESAQKPVIGNSSKLANTISKRGQLQNKRGQSTEQQPFRNDAKISITRGGGILAITTRVRTIQLGRAANS